VRAREPAIDLEDGDFQPPNIADFLSPKLLQAIDQLSLRDKGIADLYQSSEGTPTSPSELGPHHQDTPGDSAVDPDYFEVLAAEVAEATTRAIDYWSPAVRPLGGQSAVSTIAKVAAFPVAAGSADAVAAMGEPAAGGESGGPHVIDEGSTADEEASGGDWWW
jgi:hypothetical protein